MIRAAPRCMAERGPAGTSELGGELTYQRSWSSQQRSTRAHCRQTHRFLVALRRVRDLLLW